MNRLKSFRSAGAPFLDRLAALFSKMDRAYQTVADHYGFVCTGCEDNCCRTLFYHHSLLEYLYLQEGFTALDPGLKAAIIHRAQTVNRESAVDPQTGQKRRRMCPLNTAGRCLLYFHRPMICRLHGIPHELKKPGQAALMVPGCDAFTERFKEKSYFKFDRTPLYMDMAALEKELRESVGFSDKIKMTVADMVLTYDAGR